MTIIFLILLSSLMGFILAMLAFMVLAEKIERKQQQLLQGVLEDIPAFKATQCEQCDFVGSSFRGLKIHEGKVHAER